MRKVQSISLETGKKRRYPSIAIASSETGTSRSCISQAIKNRNQSGGYWFCYADVPLMNRKFRPNRARRPLWLIPVDGRERIYCSIIRNAVYICHKHIKSVRNALERGTTCGGYWLRYADVPMEGQPDLKLKHVQVWCEETDTLYPTIGTCAKSLGVKWITVQRHLENGKPINGFTLKDASQLNCTNTLERKSPSDTSEKTVPITLNGVGYGIGLVHSGSGSQFNSECVAA